MTFEELWRKQSGAEVNTLFALLPILILLAMAGCSSPDGCFQGNPCGSARHGFLSVVHAQDIQPTGPRILIGTSGAQSYDNIMFGVVAGIEKPIGKRIELQLRDSFSPFEQHSGLGSGHANILRGAGIWWMSSKFGLNETVERSSYIAGSVSKAGYYMSMGPMFRFILWDSPARLSADYIGQLHNGLSKSGIETSHLQGVAVNLSSRLGCKGAMCFRITYELSAGHILSQGNPVCDGTLGNGSQVGFAACPRQGGIGGGFTGSLELEFPRHRESEMEVF